jgi:16S rRNA (uracil1498-N3)-methyltransferase
MDIVAATAKVNSMPRFYLPSQNLRDGRGILEGQELVHLRKVLRLIPGDRVTVFDDSGMEHEAVVRQLSARQGEIEILRSYQAGRESPLQLILALGMTKGEKMDFVIEKATELGVQTIVPFASSFSMPKMDEKKIGARTARWQRIALSAVKQCGRTHTPDILPPRDFLDLVKDERPGTLKLLFWEQERRQSLHGAHAAHPNAESVLVAVGAEGGFSVREAELARSHGFEPVHLGRRILRAETAALAVLSLAQFLWGDLTST